jgi:hypothetical protein
LWLEHWQGNKSARHASTTRNRLNANVYVPDEETVLEWVRRPSDHAHLKGEEWQEYEQRFPQMRTKKIFMSNDEYAYTGGQTDLKLALAYAMVFNEMLRETDLLHMTAFTMGVSTLDYNQTSATLNTNRLLFKLYGEQLGAGSIPVAVTGTPHSPLSPNVSWATCRELAQAAQHIRWIWPPRLVRTTNSSRSPW